MNHILVRNPAVLEKVIPAKGERAAITLRYQRAAIVVDGDDFPRPFNLMLGRDRPAYAPGAYLLDPASCKVDEYENIGFSRDVSLIPIPVEAPARKAATV